MLGLLGLLAVLPLTGCKKYPDGPGVSIVSKKMRVENTWIVAKATEDGQDVSSSYDPYTLTLTRDGDATLEADYFFFGVHYVVITNGTWTFLNDAMNIMFDFEDDSQDAEYQILRLTDDQFWLRRVGADLELQLAGLAT
jgi:hypothetical protein